MGGDYHPARGQTVYNSFKRQGNRGNNQATKTKRRTTATHRKSLQETKEKKHS